MHKGDYHTDYSKYYDRSYKEKDLAYEHIKSLKQQQRIRTQAVQEVSPLKPISEEMDQKSGHCFVKKRIRKNGRNEKIE